MKGNNSIQGYVKLLREQERKKKVALVGHEPLSAEEEREVDRNTENEILAQWRKETPKVPVATLLKIIRTVLPNFPDVPSEEVAQRTQIQDRARRAYAAGRMQLSKYVPDRDAFMRGRAEQSLSALMTEEERTLYVQHAPLTDRKSYRDSGLSEEEITASIQRHEKERLRVIVRALKRMIDRDEQVILGGMDDETLIQKYPNLAVTCTMIQESVSLLTTAMKYDYEEYTADDLRALRNRASAMMDNAVDYEKRISMMADTYYPKIKLEELKSTPVVKLEALDGKMGINNLEEEFGINTDDAELKNSIENTCGIPGDISFSLRTIVPNRVARSLGFEDEKNLNNECFLYDGDGKRLSMAEMMYRVEDDKPLWIVRKDGTGEPIPIMTDPSQRTPNILVGKAAIEAAALPPKPAPMTLGQRIANGFSSLFRRRPTSRRREFDLQTAAYNRSLALREQSRTVATVPKKIADTKTWLARAIANTSRETHEAALDELMTVLPMVEIKPGTVMTYTTLATLALDCAMLDDPRDSFGIAMRDTVDAGKPGFNRNDAIRRLSTNFAFREIADDMAKDKNLLKAMRDGNKNEVRSMITRYGGLRFSPAFRHKGINAEPSEEYRGHMAQQKALQQADESVLPGHVTDKNSADRIIANKGSALAWRSAMDIYGPNRSFRPDWTPLNSRVVYTVAQWNEIKESNLDINRFRIDDAPVVDKDFASMAMVLTIRPDMIKNCGSRPGTSPFEDITMASNAYTPRDDVGSMYHDVMLPCRQLLVDCLEHMDETVPGRDQRVTGREILAAELATALVAFDSRLKGYDWRNRSQTTSCEVALRAYDFAREHGMLDMMKGKGLTDEIIEHLEIGRACSKIITEAADAEADMISENMGQSHLTPAQRRECIDKMALAMTLQAETITNKKELDMSTKPERLPNETEPAYYMRLAQWSKEMSAAMDKGDSTYEFGEVARDLLQGGRMLHQLSRHMLSDPDRQKMAASAENLGFQAIRQSNRDTLRSWGNEVREVRSLVAFQREKLHPLRSNPEAKNFVAAAEQIIQTGRPESKRLLARMTDEQIGKVCATMKEKPMLNLGRYLESSQAPSPAKPQAKAAGKQAAK